MPAGGYQAPRKPAPVSGPGSLSERTDGGAGQPVRDLPNPGYGEQKDFTEIQQAAKMAQSSKQMPAITRLDAPTERPAEPLTEGSPMGPGRGPDAYGITNTMRDKSKQEIQTIASALPLLEQAANGPNMPPSFVRFVRYLRDNA